MAKMIVIGAGVMGASVAYRLAQGGVDVTVLEATRVGGGTSGISFAWTNAHRKPPRPYHDLNVGGMKAHAALRDEFGATPCGTVAAAWNGNPKPTGRRNGRMSTNCGNGVTPPSGSIADRRWSLNRTSIPPSSATRRSRIFQRKVGSIRWFTRTPCCRPRDTVMAPR